MSDESRTTTKRIREIHGAYVTKVQSGPQEYGQKVTVADRPDYIVLNVGDATYPAGLTPDEARYIAAQLNAAADRMEKARG
jgi:hypothetical protein